MKEKPILFNTPMVQAILDGRKTMTRRIVNIDASEWGNTNVRATDQDSVEQLFKHRIFCDETQIVKCRYGKPIDMLWVRETWMENPNVDFFPDEPYYFKASKSKQFLEEWPNSWRPSIHMKKDAARIWLQIEEIRVERLQDISEEDAKAEGIEEYGPFGEYKGSIHPSGGCMRYRAYGKASRAFEDLWVEINGEDSWKATPWVWVIKFKVLSTTGRPELETTQP